MRRSSGLIQHVIPVGDNKVPFSIAAAYVPKRYLAAGTSLVFTGPGGVHTIVIATGDTSGVVELYDDTDTSSPTNQFAKVGASAVAWLLLDITVKNGLVVKLTNNPDIILSVIAQDPSLYA